MSASGESGGGRTAAERRKIKVRVLAGEGARRLSHRTAGSTASALESSLTLTFLKQGQSFVSLRRLDISGYKTRHFRLANTVL